MDIATRSIEADHDQSRSARVTAAEAASGAQKWQRAAELWEQLRAEFPTEARYWSKAGEAYSEARMFDQAELVLGEAISRFPDDQWVGYQHLIVARRRGALLPLGPPRGQAPAAGGKPRPAPRRARPAAAAQRVARPRRSRKRSPPRKGRTGTRA